jgi:hypothetical protein
MKLFYFPFTHVPQQDQDMLSAFFRKVFFISSGTWLGVPSGPFRGNNRFTPQHHGKKDSPGDTPVAPEELQLMPLPFPGKMREQVVRSLADYRQWAVHSGAGPGQLKSLLRKTPYFTSDTQVGSIRSQIQGGLSPETPRDDPSDELMKALVFLCLAGERDEQNASIDAALSTVNEKTHRLFSTLAGELPTVSPESPGGDIPFSDPSLVPGKSVADPGALMTPSRLSSWFRVFQEVGGAFPEDEPCVFITTSPAVLAFFERIAPGGNLLLNKGGMIENRKNCAHSNALKDQVMADINAALSGPEQDLGHGDIVHGECPSGQLNLYLFKGAGIKDFFCPGGKKGRSFLPLSWIERGIFVCFMESGK